jgi:2'-5' RNA ligase
MSAPATLRLFVAIDPPEPIRAALQALPRPLRGVAWTPPHQYHLTLRFLGETPANQRGAIEPALAAVRVESFILPVSGVGAFSRSAAAGRARMRRR